MDVYTTKITRIYNDQNGKIIIETADSGCFYQSFAETANLRPIEQTDALYRSFQVGDEIEYKKSGRSTWIILRNKTQDKRDVKSFVEAPEQHMIVTNFWYSKDGLVTNIECLGARGSFTFRVERHVALRLLDEIIVKEEQGMFTKTNYYQVESNVTLEQDAQRAFQEKVLCDWSKEKRALLSDLSTDSNHRKR